MIINFLVGLQSLVVEMLLLMGMGKNVFWVGRFCFLTVDQALLTCVDRFVITFTQLSVRLMLGRSEL